MGEMQMDNKTEELREAALPLLEFLNKHYHHNAYAIVSEGSVEVVEGSICASLPIRD